MIKKTALSLALAASICATSCLGPNNAYNSLRNWNATAMQDDWLAEIVFIGLWIVPVYPVALLGDNVIFNTIDYWSGDNPISDPGLFPKAEFGK